MGKCKWYVLKLFPVAFYRHTWKQNCINITEPTQPSANANKQCSTILASCRLLTLFFPLSFLEWKVKVLVAQLCPTLCNPRDCSSPGSFVYRILQARILEWVAISFSRKSSQPRDGTQISCITGRFFTFWTNRGRSRWPGGLVSERW